MNWRQETQRSICEWGTRTFGSGPASAQAARMALEAAELVMLMTDWASRRSGDCTELAEEVADVVIVAMQVGDRTGVRMMLPSPVEQAGQFPNLERLLELAAAVNSLSVVINNRVLHGLPCAEELTRLLDHCAELCLLVNRDLRTAVNRKMEINRARRWRRSENGGHQHAEE